MTIGAPSAEAVSGTSVDMLVDRYISIWNEQDEDLRRELVAMTWAANATYLDPLLGGDGHEGIDAMTAGFQNAYPGYTFRRVSAVDQHHDRIRFAWELVTPEGQTFVLGTDFGVITGDNQLASITGFFEPA